MHTPTKAELATMKKLVAAVRASSKLGKRASDRKKAEQALIEQVFGTQKAK